MIFIIIIAAIIVCKITINVIRAVHEVKQLSHNINQSNDNLNNEKHD